MATETQKSSKAKRVVKAEPKNKMRLKSEMMMYHHLFRSDTLDCLKDVSYKHNNPKIVKTPHTHFFHSIDSNGKALKTTNACLGHFHDVSWTVGEDGEVTAVCGPAMRRIVKRTSQGMKKVIEPLRYYDDLTENYIVDEHKHDLEYLYSEEFHADTARKMNNQVAQQLATEGKPKTTDGMYEMREG